MPYVPTITTMIRLDHTHVVAAFHRYGSETAWWRKRAIVNSVCRALEIHAQLEEEIFYPALARIAPTDETLKKSRPEHDELREVIAKLRPPAENGRPRPSLGNVLRVNATEIGTVIVIETAIMI